MKKIVFSLSFIAIAIFAFIACEKDQITPLDTQTTVIEYTILVVDAGSSLKSSTGLDGVSISIASEGKTRTAITNTSGQATFSGLKPGVVAVTVEKSDFLTANFLANLKPVGTYDNISFRSAATRIALIPNDSSSAATVTCTINADTDLSDTIVIGDSPKSGVFVIANMTSAGALATDIGSDGSVTGLTIDGTVVTSTTNSLGEITLSLPATMSGVTYSIAPQTFETNQTQIDSTVADNIFNVNAQNLTVVSGGTYVIEFNMAK